MKKEILTSLVVTTLLVWCGGGSSSDQNTTPTQKPQVKVDKTAPVLSSSNKTFKTKVGETLVLVKVSAKDDKDGIIKVIKTGSVDFNTAGTYEVVYTAKDKAGNISKITHTYIVQKQETVEPNLEPTPNLNKVPVAKADSFVVKYGESKTFDVLANDSDENKATLKIIEVDNVVWGTFVVENNKIKFTPDVWFSWEIKTNYTIQDEKGETAKWEIKVNVEKEVIIDTEAPKLSSKNKTFKTKVWAPLKLENITATDNVDKDVKVVKTWKVDFNKAWTYEIVYEAKDTAWNVSKITHTYEVEEKVNEAPVLNSVKVETDYSLQDYGNNNYSISKLVNHPVTFTIDANDTEWDGVSIIVNWEVYNWQTSYTETLNLKWNEIKKFIIEVQDENWNKDKNQDKVIQVKWE